MGHLDTSGVEERAGADEEGVRPLAPKICKGRIDFPAGVGVEHLNLQPHGAGSRLQVSQRRLVSRCIGGIDEHGNTSSTGHHLAQEFQPLCHQLGREKIDPRQVAAGPGEACDQTQPNRVFGNAEDDGDRRGCRLGRQPLEGDCP